MSKPGLVIDIDGVIYRGGVLCEGTKEAFERVVQAGLPYVFATNGGGYTEANKAKALNELLGRDDIGGDSVVMAHTPFLGVDERLRTARVLVGGDLDSMGVMAAYGFTKAEHIDEYAARHPELITHEMWTRMAIRPENVGPAPPGYDEEPVAAIFLVHNSEHWGRDLQILVDVVRFSGAVPKTMDEYLAKKAAPADQIPVFIANPDLVYQDEYAVPRFTMGAFEVALRALYEAQMGVPLQLTVFGKPLSTTYGYIADILRARNAGDVYAIGDNPLSDIKGANAMGERWHSILVRTGVFQGAENDADHPAKHVVANFAAAVDLVLSRTA